MGSLKVKERSVAVIGAGASGLMAACYAAESSNVVLFEKQQKIGRKILITGNGRCNISNRNANSDKYHGENPRFVNNVLSRFGVDATEAFFSSIGIPFVEENEGRLFPASLQASAVPKMFQYELKKLGVDLQTGRRVDAVKRKGEGFLLVTAGKEEHYCDSLILAAGSCAYTSLGSGMSGYEIASSLGHRIIEPWPVILPINIPLKMIHILQGIKRDVSVSVKAGGSVIAQSTGELLFTAYGISGPASLMVSRAVNEAVRLKKDPVMEIDLFPQLSHDELRRLMGMVWGEGDKKFAFSMLGVLKERMPEVLCRMAGIDPERRVSTVSAEDRTRFIGLLKAMSLTPGEPRSFKEAVAAAGGVAVDEINPATMESRLVKNLFITGELLDIDGDSGGYNLQFAWSSGAIAGMAQSRD